MPILSAKRLHTGDEVFWEDPDNGLCSRRLTICEIKYKGDGSFSIIDTDGGHLECFAKELK